MEVGAALAELVRRERARARRESERRILRRVAGEEEAPGGGERPPGAGRAVPAIRDAGCLPRRALEMPLVQDEGR
jgi:hypothetical protein